MTKFIGTLKKKNIFQAEDDRVGRGWFLIIQFTGCIFDHHQFMRIYKSTDSEMKKDKRERESEKKGHLMQQPTIAAMTMALANDQR